MYRWTKTQNLDISNQLKAGIRYFDMRVASKVGDADLYFVHGLYGRPIMEMMHDINVFLNEYPREIIFIDFQHFYAVSDVDHKKLIDDLTSLFRHRIVPNSSILMMEKMTLKHLWSKGQQVFIYYRNEEARMHNPNFWPSRALPNPWPNTVNRNELINFLDNEVSKRALNTMFVTQGILTPTDSFVGLRFLSSLRSLIIPCNQTLNNWLKDKSVGAKGPNIVMCDSIEWDGYKIPLQLIKLNGAYSKN